MTASDVAAGTATFRVYAMAAVAAGSLRALTIVTYGLPAGVLAVIYAVTDLLILAGIAGIWLQSRRTLDTAARIGLVLAVVGGLIIRVAAFGLLGRYGYQLGAAIELVGFAVYSVDRLRWRTAARVAPVLWIAALISGLASVAVATVVLTAVGGVLFGAALVVTGFELARGALGAETSGDSPAL